MLKTYLATASVAAMLATGAMAQTTAPAPTAPAAPAQSQTAPGGTTMTRAANEQLTTSKLQGISIYAPKPDAAATTGSTAAPARPSGNTAAGTAGTPGAAGTSGTAGTAATPGTAGTAGTGGSMASGGMTGGQMMITPVSDEQWRTMRDRHDSIGTISDLVVGADGRISHAVLGVGGFLGIGEKNVALPLNQVRLMRQSDGTLIGFVTSTKAQLQEMPNFTASRS
ncbi:MAG: PRC-barrel domain-containing protein [Phreatobacter sp.]|uniref:PRC-barrel domain-containing protein n=1 Tax=Phreatobacter sp. TaxID=1966341 RepID=UPI004035A013